MKTPICPKCAAAPHRGGTGDNIARNLPNSIMICLRNYVTFQGRAPRAEFWWFTLFQVIVQLSLPLLITMVWPGQDKLAAAIVSLALFLPSIAVSVRRLHDLNRSGWWMWIVLIPVIGALVLLVWYCTRGTRGSNRFGASNGLA
jgi:uncharacterized membrane protein YhaH (DUF805 family)